MFRAYGTLSNEANLLLQILYASGTNPFKSAEMTN